MKFSTYFYDKDTKAAVITYSIEIFHNYISCQMDGKLNKLGKNSETWTNFGDVKYELLEEIENAIYTTELKQNNNNMIGFVSTVEAKSNTHAKTDISIDKKEFMGMKDDFYPNHKKYANGEDCFEYFDVSNCDDKKAKVKFLGCTNYKKGKCYDKKRVWIDGKLVTVATVNEDCDRHGWVSSKTCGGTWVWDCYLNNREMEESACRTFKKW